MTKQPNQFRIFCAIEFPAPVRERAMKHINHLRQMFPDVQASWSRETNVHLTVKFIGNVDIDHVHHVSAAASRAVAGLSPFTTTLGQTGTFPKSGIPRVLWIGIDDSTGKLAELHRSLEEECDREGFPKEQRPFHPHLTIARLRKPAGARELAQAHKQLPFDPIEILVSELMVIRSELSSKGSKYTAISSAKMINDR